MSNRLILCVAGSGVSKDALALCLDGIEDAQIEYADTLSALRKRMRDVSPAVIIAPWSDAGVTLLGTRSTMHSFDPSSSLPALLALTQSITPAKIALAKSAAAVDLIPSEPFDGDALRNRLIWILQGASALGEEIMGDGDAFHKFLDGLPALRKRLAA